MWWRFAGVALAAASVGCGPSISTWAPPPPSGATYAYEHQGFAQRSSTAIAGVAGGGGGSLGVVGAGSTTTTSGVVGDSAADPLGESAPIDGVRFNEHLDGRGVRVVPAAAPSASPPGARTASRAWSAGSS